MKKNVTILLIGLGLLLSCTSSYTNTTDDIPRIIFAFGRFHPLILHLPIGALILTFCLDIIGRLKKEYPKTTIKYALGFTAFFSVLACILGYFLSLEGGYEKTVLDLHFWTGIGTAILTTVLFLLSISRKKELKVFFFPVFISSIVCICFAGHFGSVLTHGAQFITKHIKPLPKAKIITQIDSLKMYDDVIYTILNTKCVQCHNGSKRKGELALDSKSNILKGGESGSIIQFEKASNSILYKQLILPISDKNHMPPQGKPQLTKDEIWLINYWINHCNDFNTKVSRLVKSDTLKTYLKKYLIFPKTHIKEAPLKTIKQVEKAGFLVRKLSPNTPELWVKFNKDSISKKTIKTVLKLKEQVVELDLSNCNLTDNMISVIGQFKNLNTLKVNNTLITDKAFKNINKIKTLKVLHLVNTSITALGLKSLLKTIAVKRVYAWKTNITDVECKNIQHNYKIHINNGVPKGFVKIAHLKPPILLTKRTLFIDTLTFHLDAKLKGTSIFYTLDKTEPDSTSLVYSAPIVIDTTSHIAIKAYKKGWLSSKTMQKTFIKVSHKVNTFTVLHQPEKQYSGTKKLFDFQMGSKNFKDEKWNGFLGHDLNVSIDLGKKKQINAFSVNCLGRSKDWILFPKNIKIYSSKTKDSGYKLLKIFPIKADDKHGDTMIKEFKVNLPKPVKSQYFKIIVKNPKVLPKWHEGAGNPPWIFVDEIIIW